MAERSNDRVGEQIGNYQIVDLLGKGGYGDVYLGEHIHHKKKAAIKIFHRHVSDIDLEEILNEARTIARLEHPHIIRIFECNIDNDYPFLVMGYAPYGSLRQRHPRGEHLSSTQVVSYVQPVAAALQYAHEHKLVHRDVKPENMLVGENGQILLSDFGLVTFSRTTGSQTTGDMRGTVAYMAPEQLHGKPRTASDQYALAVVVYEWLCGRRPFNGSFAEIASQHILAQPPSLREQVPDLAPAVERVIFKAMAKHPSDRFENITIFAQALHQASLSIIPSRSYASSGQLATPKKTKLLTPPPDDSGSSRTNKSSGNPLRLSLPPEPLEELSTELDVARLWSYEDSTPASNATQQAAKPAPITEVTKTVGEELPPARHPARPFRLARNRTLRTLVILLGLFLLVGGSLALGTSMLAPSHPAQDQQQPAGGMTTAIASTSTPHTIATVARHNDPTTEARPTATKQPTSAPTPKPTNAPTPKPTAKPTQQQPTPTPTSVGNPPLPPLPTVIGGILP